MSVMTHVDLPRMGLAAFFWIVVGGGAGEPVERTYPGAPQNEASGPANSGPRLVPIPQRQKTQGDLLGNGV